MRNRDLLRCAGALALGMLAAVSYSSSASAFSGLSDKQKSHIEVNIHCNILLWTDLKAFEADSGISSSFVRMGGGRAPLDPADRQWRRQALRATAAGVRVSHPAHRQRMSAADLRLSFRRR